MMADNVSFDRPSIDGLGSPPHFANVVISEGGKLAHISGMMATEGRELIGAGDLAAQMQKTFENLDKALVGIGATPGHVVRQRIFVVDMELGHRDIVVNAMNEFYGDYERPASTLVGVQSLIVEGAMVEIDLTAAVD